MEKYRVVILDDTMPCSSRGIIAQNLDRASARSIERHFIRKQARHERRTRCEMNITFYIEEQEV